MKTKSFYFNCFFGILYLIWRRKLSYVYLMKQGRCWYPHFRGITRRGHMLSFCRSYPKAGREPWWFNGHFEGCAKSQMKQLRSNYVIAKIKVGSKA